MASFKLIFASLLLLTTSSTLKFIYRGSGNENVSYFIDADCQRCSIQGYRDTGIWIATAKIYPGDFNRKNIQLEKFKELIKKKYGVDTTLTNRLVFRYQNTESEAARSYAARENKMKMRHYVIIKQEFDPDK